jgi:3-oxoacyl-[acyl-carrier protein] reductase
MSAIIHPQRFEGRVALVTGGASGIGRAVAERLHLEGARVVAWDIDSAKLDALATSHSHGLHIQRVDVTDNTVVQSAMSELVAGLKRLDIVVNAAGIVGPSGPFWEVTPEQWSRVLRINLDGTFLVTRAAQPHLVANGWGRVVNLASVTAKEAPRHLGPYAATKAGIVGLTKSMGKDLAGTGVLVNAVAPALIATELLGQLTPEYYAAAMAKIPLGRAGTLDEASSMITWLCSEECSFSTGAVFDLTGGRGQ